MKFVPVAIIVFVLCISSQMLVQAEEITDSIILFCKSYENYAWSAEYKGITVDSTGKVHSFSYQPDNLGPLAGPLPAKTAEELYKKFQPGKKLIRTVNMEELQKMVALIPEIKIASLSEPIRHGADMGSYLWLAYQHDKSSNTYDEVLIKEKGDSRRDRATPAAKILVDWLDSLDQKK